MGSMATLAALSSSIFSKPFISLSLRPSLRALPRFTCSLSSSSSSSPSPPIEFDITFAPSKAKPKTEPFSGNSAIPWIVRGEDGELKIQWEPPASFLQDTTGTNTQVKKKKEEKKKKASSATQPKYSKAARRYYNEHFREQPQRISKVLAASGVASRRSSEQLVFDGKVTVNGSLCTTPQTRVDPTKDIIYVNGSRLPKTLPPKVYLALNKPKGYICSSGKKESKSVFSLFDDYMKTWNQINPGIPKPRLFTVGRLDVATTGLIVVTNDGDFAQQLSHPSSNLTKEYIASVNGTVSKGHLIAISEGTVIDGVHCTPDSVELLQPQPNIPKPRIRIVVHEGRNHEVRELVKNAGLVIYSLKRVRIGGFRLPTDLGLGNHIELKQSHLKAMGWTSAKTPTPRKVPQQKM